MPSRADLDLAEQLRSAVGDLVRHIRALDELPPNQSAVLGRLHRGGSMSIADLARLEHVKHQSMRRTVNLLRATGLVGTGASPQDGREVVVSIQKSGVAILRRERARRAASIARAASRLSPEERRVLGRVPEIFMKLINADH